MKVHTRGCLEVLGYQVSHLDTIWITLGHYFLGHLDIGELHGYSAWIPSGVTEIHKSRLIVKISQLSENSSAIGGLTFIVALIQIHKSRLTVKIFQLSENSSAIGGLTFKILTYKIFTYKILTYKILILKYKNQNPD